MPNVRRFTAAVLIVVSTLVGHQIANSQIQQPDAPTKYTIDNGHSSIVFAVSHFGLSYTYGRFNKIAGDFSLNGGELTTAGFSFAIDAKSIDTNNSERDKHLRGPDFFDTDQFPEIKFVTTGFTKVDGVYQITGDMTMRGQTRAVKMPVKLVGIGKGPFGAQRAGYFAKFTLKRDEFGLDKMAGQIGNNISVTFSFEGVKQ